ncbi:MAG: glutathione S-transferase family protein [Deltaproteobacteria bacterium]|jgi:glutathione S-transferase|nr:glutathione S-transferase family protein [Deltaproteobacteria bacterium]MBW2500943.1 glutathione S-transferase family protein [Deltaproteobacteria bacterium]
MLTVYHLEGSRSDRLIWLLEELGLDYEVEAFAREDGRAPAAMKALHPLAKAPMLRDGERLLIESGAIFEYLLARHGDGGLVPAVDDPDWPDYVQWLHYAEGSAMLPMVLDHFQQAGLCGPPGETPIAEMARSELDRLYDHLEAVLSERPWLAGDRFTAADVMMGWVIEMIEARGEIGSRAALARYVEAIRARPAHQRAQVRATGGSA